MANELRVRARNLPPLIVDVELSAVGTTLSAPELASYPVIGATNHLAIFDVDDPGSGEIMYITAHTASGSTATVVRAREGTTGKIHAVGAELHHGPTVRDFAVGNVDFVKYNGGDISINSATWVNLNTALDLTVPAEVGDLLEVGLNALWESQAAFANLDVATWDGSSLQTWFGDGEPTTSTGGGVMGWFGNSGVFMPIGGSTMKLAVAADIASGNVTCRFRVRTSGAKEMRATSGDGAIIAWLKNHGPQYVAAVFS